MAGVGRAPSPAAFGLVFDFACFKSRPDLHSIPKKSLLVSFTEP
jgi:hypothetical protein